MTDDGGGTRLVHVGLVDGDPAEPLRISRPGDETVVGRNLRITLPAELERRDALVRLYERLRDSVLPKQWWSSIQCFEGLGTDTQGAVALRMPRSVGTSVLLTDGALKRASGYENRIH